MKTKNIIILLSLALFAFMMITNVNAYKRICLNENENLVLNNETIYECKEYLCILCTKDDLIPTNPSYCNNLNYNNTYNCEYLFEENKDNIGLALIKEQVKQSVENNTLNLEENNETVTQEIQKDNPIEQIMIAIVILIIIVAIYYLVRNKKEKPLDNIQETQEIKE